MDGPIKRGWRLYVGLLGAVLGPMIVFTDCLLALRWLEKATQASIIGGPITGYVVVGISLGAGLMGIVLLPLKGWVRWVTAAFYVHVTLVVLYVYALVFACVAFRDCY